MQKVLLSILGIVVGLILIATILPNVITDVTTDDYGENFNVSTGAGVTSTDETLTYDHYYGDLTDLSATSDNENDTPVVMSYNEDTKVTNVDGLQASASRILNIAYVREAHQEFTGTSTFIRMIPLILVMGLMVAGIWGLFTSIRGRG